MIKYKTGDLLKSNCEALVNTVNCVGVMGKGIALAYRLKYPDMFHAYVDACAQGKIKIGLMWLWRDIETNKLVINFPTKQHWIRPSKIEWIEYGLQDLVNIIEEHNLKSLALPKLGCGNGGLNWENVKSLIEQYMSNLDCMVEIYE